MNPTVSSGGHAILTAENVSASEVYHPIQKIYGTEYMSRKSVYR